MSYNESLQTNNTNLQSVLDTANTEISEQATLISQIKTALEGKAAGSETEVILQSKIITPSTSQQIIMADSGYTGLEQVTVNAMPSATQATPSISVSSGGLITASVTQSAGYVVAGTKSATKQLSVQAAKTITPSASSQTAVASGVYTTGAVTVAGDSNLIASNIKSGVSIFGVSGSYEGSGGSSGGSGSVGPVVPPEIDAGDTETGSIEVIGTIPILYCTAEGSVIYTYISDGNLEVSVESLTYFATLKKYRIMMNETTVLNTPFVILTSGTISFPSITGHTATQLASGTGYAVYKITKDS